MSRYPMHLFGFIALGALMLPGALIAAPLSSYGVLGGSGEVELKEQAVLTGGLLGGNGEVELKNKVTTGDILCIGKVEVDGHVTTGSITTASTVKLEGQSTVGPIAQHAAVAPVQLPPVNVNPDLTKNIDRSSKDAKAGPLTLTPGRYGKVSMEQKDHLILQSGEYHFESLKLEWQGKLTINLTPGKPLVVRVHKNLRLDREVAMTVNGGDARDILFLIDGEEAWLRLSGS